MGNAPAFTEHYRAHVIPRLRKLCRTQGTFVDMGTASFNEAAAYIWREAVRLGASRLDTVSMCDLEDKIEEWLYEAIDFAEAYRHRITIELELYRKQDPEGYYRWLIPNDEGLRRALMAMDRRRGR